MNNDDRLILIVDDEPELISTVASYLRGKGFRVEGVNDSDKLFSFLNNEVPDLLILDIMLPGGMDGFEICAKIKGHERFESIPVIMLSANGAESDRVNGLDLGADDYMPKPFSLKELYSRINAVLRRSLDNESSGDLTVADKIKIDPRKFQVSVNDRLVELTSTEFKILQCLARRKGHVFTRERILSYLWGDEKIVVHKTVDVHIRHLREKLSGAGDLIKNVRGVGYKIEE